MSPRPRSSSSITSLSLARAPAPRPGSCGRPPRSGPWSRRSTCDAGSYPPPWTTSTSATSRTARSPSITIDRPERMNAIGPRTADELRDAWTRFRDDDGALVGVLTGAGRRRVLRRRRPQGGLGGRPRHRARRRHPRPDALDRPAQADDRRRQRRRLRGRAGVGVLDRPLRRRRPRDVRRHLPALEHRARRRRHPAAAADRRLPRGHGADPHRPGDRRARGAPDRAGQRGRPAGHLPAPRARARPRARRAARSPRCGRTRRRRCAAAGRPLDEGLRIEAECFDRLVGGAEMAEGLRRFNERDHPDRGDGPPLTPGLARPQA